MRDSYRAGHQPHVKASELERAVQYHISGQLEKAAETYRKILETSPDNSRALHLLGVVADQSGETDKAVNLMKRALQIDPNDPACHCDLGLALHNGGKPEEAIGFYQKAIQLRPDFFQAHNNLGYSLEFQGRLDEAISCYRKAIQLRPDFFQAHNNLGNALRSQSKLEKAISCYQKAIQLQPGFAKAYNNMGSAFRSQGRLKEAISCFKKAVGISPKFAEAYNNMGNMFLDEGRVDEAVLNFEKSLEIRPDPGIEVKKAFVLPVIPDSVRSINWFRRKLTERIGKIKKEGISLHDPNEQVGRPPFYLAYYGLNNKELQQQIASMYIHACPDLAWVSPDLDKEHLPSDRITVGIISSFFYKHTIGKLMYGIIKNLSREKFHVRLFRCPGKEDELSQDIDRASDEVVMLPGNLRQARQKIAEYCQDILLYLDIGMDSLTYFLAFSRLALVQCVTWGHPDTTGIPNIDYFISSAHAEPLGAQDHYSERLVKLKRFPMYYKRQEVEINSKHRKDFNIPKKCNLYVCAQSLFKCHPEFDAVLGNILRRDPHGLLVLFDGPKKYMTELLRERLLNVFPDQIQRVQFRPRMPFEDFLSFLTLSDVVLDTTHFSGGLTSLISFACDTPIVTWPGDFMRGRLTLAFYKQMGVMDCVAQDAKSYVDIALRLANDRDWKEEVVSKIRTHAHVLYEDLEAVHELERFFEWALGNDREETNQSRGNQQ
jgi:predicted O-linked N-acetylglucosamine transferase (SPINDLY family)